MTGTNRPFIQVPSSSPVNSPDASPIKMTPPSRITSLKLQFSYNGSSMLSASSSSTSGDYSSSNSSNSSTESSMSSNSSGSNGIVSSKNSPLSAKLQSDLPILKKKYPGLKESIIIQTWKRKNGQLRQIIDFLESLKRTHPQFFNNNNGATSIKTNDTTTASKSQSSTASVGSNTAQVLSPNIASQLGLGRLASLDSNVLPNRHSNDQSFKNVKSTKLDIKKKLTISQKFGFKQNHALSIEAEPTVKRRKLVRGSRNPKPEYLDDFINDDVDEEKEREELMQSEKKQAKVSKPKKKSVIDLSDEEEEEEKDFEDSDKDEDYPSTKIETHSSRYVFNERLLNFLNTAALADICDIGGCDPSIAEILISKRPFNNLEQIENDDFSNSSLSENTSKSVNLKKRGGSKKANGLKIVEKTEVSLKGYDAVDSLVEQCSQYGKIIEEEIKKWGIGSRSVNEEQGELEITEVADDDDDLIVTKSSKIDKKKLIDHGTYFKHKPIYLAKSLNLKSYQQVGINWLNLLYQNNLSCILADEMGLGKTCQVISFFAYLREIDPKNKQPHLVVVPSSTLENWLREFQKFCPYLKVAPYYGSQQERYELRNDLHDTEFDILVTTYNLATGQKDDVKFLKNQNFNVVVYDEGHMLKNSNSERYNKLMKIKANFRLLLTGTPLQNNLKELISLLAFILPSLFSEKKEDLQVLFNQKVTTKQNNNDMKSNQNAHAEDDNDKDKQTEYNPLISERAISRAKTMMTPFVLRRKKLQVLKNLPKKNSRIVYCDNTGNQIQLYDDQLLEGKRLKQLRKQSNIIMKLRKAAIHPLLFRSKYTNKQIREMAKSIMKEPVYHDANYNFIVEDMEVMTDIELYNLCLKFPKTMKKYCLNIDDEIYNSGKFIKLKELLLNYLLNDKNRILIFSLFTQVLDLLEILLSDMNIKFLRLDGQTSVELRQDIIDEFHKDESIKVFILSTKAGGFGINLTCANNVIIFDQSFNPHDDRQAEDRAHRVGQERDVEVIRLISKDTIEENIYKLAQNKLALDESVSRNGTTSNPTNKNEDNDNESLLREIYK